MINYTGKKLTCKKTFDIRKGKPTFIKGEIYKVSYDTIAYINICDSFGDCDTFYRPEYCWDEDYNIWEYFYNPYELRKSKIESLCK